MIDWNKLKIENRKKDDDEEEDVLDWDVIRGRKDNINNINNNIRNVLDWDTIRGRNKEENNTGLVENRKNITNIENNTDTKIRNINNLRENSNVRHNLSAKEMKEKAKNINIVEKNDTANNIVEKFNQNKKLVTNLDNPLTGKEKQTKNKNTDSNILQKNNSKLEKTYSEKNKLNQNPISIKNKTSNNEIKSKTNEVKENEEINFIDKLISGSIKVSGTIKNIAENLALGVKDTFVNSGYAMQFNRETTNNDYKINTLRNQNISDEIKKRNINELTTMKDNSNKTKQIQLIENVLIEDNQKIQENILNSEGIAGQTLAELAPSIGNSLTAGAISSIPGFQGLGSVLFFTSATGSYIQDAKQRGMTDEQAIKYGNIMGTIEGISESIVSKEAFSGAKKILTGKGLSEVIKENFLVNMTENFLQESLIDPVNEYVAEKTGGKDKAEWNGMAEQMIIDGLKGALSAVLLDTITAGIAGSTRQVIKTKNKIENNQNLSKTEIKETLKSLENNVGQEEFQKLIKDNFNVNKENANIYKVTHFRNDEISRIENTIGMAIPNPNEKLNANPAIVQIFDKYMAVDTKTGIQLDYVYDDAVTAYTSFNSKVSNLSENEINKINRNIQTTQEKLDARKNNYINQIQSFGELPDFTKNTLIERLEKADAINIDNAMQSIENLRQIYSNYEINQEDIKVSKNQFSTELAQEENKDSKDIENILNNYGLNSESINEIKFIIDTEKPSKLDDIYNIVDNYRETNIEIENEDADTIKNIKNLIKNTKLDVNEIKESITDYNQFRKNNFGKINIGNDGMEIDTFYKELVSQYPTYFDSDIYNTSDQLNAIVDFVNNVSEKNSMYNLTDEDVSNLSNEIFNYIKQENQGKQQDVPKIIKRKLKEDFQEKGYIDLNNIKINSIGDIVDLSQIFRNPKYETFRVIYLKDNVIVGQEAISSKIPGQTTIKRFENTNKNFFKMKERMKRLNANGYYMIHNHPSGKAVASKNDISTTEFFMKKVDGFKGHIIVNSGTYASITNTGLGLKVENSINIKDYSADEIDSLMKNEPWNQIKVTDRNGIAQIMHNVKNSENYSSLILVDSQSFARIVIDVPNSFFNMKSEQIEGYIRNQAKQNGAVKSFIATTDEKVLNKLEKINNLTDVILYENDNENINIIKSKGTGNEIFSSRDKIEKVDVARLQLPGSINQVDTKNKVSTSNNNDIKSKKKTNKTTLSDEEIRDIVKYNPDGREIQDTDYVDFMMERFKDNKNISGVITNTDYVNIISEKSQNEKIENLYKQIKNKNIQSDKVLKNREGSKENVHLDVLITKTGLNESFHKSISNEKYAIVPYLDKIIETSQDGIIRSETKNRKNILGWYYLYNTAEINGKLYSVKVDLKQTQQGDRLYVHRVNIIHKEELPSQAITDKSARDTVGQEVPLKKSIPQNNQSVKNKIMQKSSNDNGVRTMKKDTSRSITTQTNTTVDNQGRILTKEQQEYFKDSKIRDDNGNLLTLYHGSSNQFTIFDQNKSGKSGDDASIGFWFTETRGGAEKFTKASWYSSGNSNVYEVYLDIKNPKIYKSIDNSIELEQIDKEIKDNKQKIKNIEDSNIAIEINSSDIRWASDESELDDIAKAYGFTGNYKDKFIAKAKEYQKLLKQQHKLEKEYENKRYNDAYERFKNDIYIIAGKTPSDANAGGTGMYIENYAEVIKQYKQKLEKQGYDGIIIEGTKYDSVYFGKNNNQYVAFNANQIKNVTNKKPTNSKDIRLSKKDTQEKDSSKTNAERKTAFIEQRIQRNEKNNTWNENAPKTSRMQINRYIESFLDTYIKKGRFRQRAYAIYKINSDLIRTKELKDIDSIMHETGHAISKRYNPDKNSIALELLDAIQGKGYDNETEQIRMEEGFAEIIREYSIEPDAVKEKYPDSYEYLRLMRSRDKGLDNFFRNVQKMNQDYADQNPESRASSNISVGSSQIESKTLNDYKSKAIKAIYDRDYYLKKTVDRMAKVKGKKSINQLDSNENAYLMMKLASGKADKIQDILENGIIDEKTGEKITEGFSGLGKILGNDEKLWNALRVMLISNRDLDYKKSGLQTGLRSKDTEYVRNKYKNNLKIQKALNLIYSNLNGQLDYMRKSGMISKEQYKEIKKNNLYYIPMQRVIDETNNMATLKGKGDVSNVTRKRTGSERDIIDPLENIITNTAYMMNQKEKNDIMRAFIELGEEVGNMGDIYDIVPTPMKKVAVAELSKFENELKNQGIDTSEMDLEAVYEIWQPNRVTDERKMVTSYLDRRGKRVFVEFKDKEIFSSVMGMNKDLNNQFTNFVKMLNTPLKLGATTYNFQFAIKNAIRDSFQASIYSDTNYIPIIDTFAGIINVLASRNGKFSDVLTSIDAERVNKIKKLHSLYLQSGASNSNSLSPYRKETQNKMSKVYGTTEKALGLDNSTIVYKDKFDEQGNNKVSKFETMRKKLKPLNNFLNALGYISELSEEATRFRNFEKEFNKFIKDGMSYEDALLTAGYNARNITQDFSNSGTVMQDVNKFIPFSNARVNSAYNFINQVSRNPKKVGIKLALLLTATLAIKALADDSDNKRLEEIDDRTKGDYWLFALNDKDELIKIAKPQGILKSILNFEEYMYDLLSNNIDEGDEGKKLVSWISNTINDNMPSDTAGGLLPPIFQALAENSLNIDFYYKTPIVKEWDLTKKPEDQYYEYNSQLAIELGKIFKYSPAKIDNFINGTLAGFGTQLTKIIDSGIGIFKEIPQKADLGKSSGLVSSTFYANGYSNSQSISKIYDLKDELTTKKEYNEATKQEIEQLENIEKATSQLSEINKEIKSIKKSLTTSAKEKGNKINELQILRTDVARYYLNKNLIDKNNESKIENYVKTNSTSLSSNGWKLDLTEEMQKEYKNLVQEKYSEYKKQGLVTEEKAQSSAKEYAKKFMLNKYKNQLYKSK